MISVIFTTGPWATDVIIVGSLVPAEAMLVTHGLETFKWHS